ncbi:xanthine dehydrogenase family protein subunit M (plasmid) [Tistrella mobilis]|jgi:xanthine dehydrogenase YagS FAD-binding subunit|uniref:FAD binding domain-containing protein n=1 Tax=Tistrella mobilis TaxID=171437 RepID=UPI00355813EC
MQPFRIAPATSAHGPASSGARQIAGGTNLVDLMRLGVERPAALVDLDKLPAPSLRGITRLPDGTFRIGALTRMAEALADPALCAALPMVAQSLALAASPQIRNMASLGGNLLQRTRCPYFRDVSWPCNKRERGSGCAAMEGITRHHAILGTSGSCIAAYPGDFAQAALALDARIEITGKGGLRRMNLARLHRLPGGTPDAETALDADETITAIYLPAPGWARRSLFLKRRERAAYSFALVSVACALDMAGDRVREVRLALGGVATIPWRAVPAERLLAGERLTEECAHAAGVAAFADAVLRPDNAFKRDLGVAMIARALIAARDLDITEARP